MTVRAILLAATTFLFTTPAFAEDAWEFRVTPYLWLAGVDGDVGARPGVPPTDVDVGFDDVFDSLEGYFMGKLEARHGRFGAVLDFDYLEISGAHELRIGHVLAANADVSIGTTDATLAGYYRVHENARTSVDLFAGARYTSLDLEVSGNVNAARFSGEADKGWWDPVFGVRGHWQSEGAWGLTGYADYGGFGVSSDAVWQVYGAVDYRFTDMLALAVGYRQYGVDYADAGGLDVDVQLGGPLIGLSFTF